MSGKAVRETLAALGVIASLVFVGVEIRQNTVVARAGAQNELASAVRDITLTIASDAELQRIWARWRDDEPLEPENVLTQAQTGVVGSEVLTTYAFSGSMVAQSENFRGWWPSYRGRLLPDFVDFFEAEYDLAP